MALRNDFVLDVAHFVIRICIVFSFLAALERLTFACGSVLVFGYGRSFSINSLYGETT
jgi:hypothetical protein